MADTIRDEAALLVIFADNTTGEISPQDFRDFIVSSRIDSVATHLTATNNPHNVTAAQVGSATAQWNADQLQGNAVKDETPSVDGYVLTWNDGLSQWESQVNIAVAHIADTDNPHSVTAAQVGNATAQWNADQLQGNAVKDETPSVGGYVLTWNQSGPYWEAQENTQGVDVEEDDANVLVNTATLNFGTGFDAADGGGSQADITLDNSEIDHDALYNFAANEHIDHSSLSIIAGDGLTGTGDITSDVTLSVDINGADSATVATGDEVMVRTVAGYIRKVPAGDIANLGPVVNWTGSNSTYDSVEFAKWTPSSSTGTNVVAIFQPKGNRGIQAQQANGFASGGNNRGQYSVDLQMKRFIDLEVAAAYYSVVGGGYRNLTYTNATYCVTVGGHDNSGSSEKGFLGGGKQNYVGYYTDPGEYKYNVCCGGLNNGAFTVYSFVGGGELSRALFGSPSNSRTHDVVCGGESNQVNTDPYSHGFVGGGKDNRIDRSYASILGGLDCRVEGDYSIAMGRRAKTGSYSGVFVFADSTNSDFPAPAADTFCIRASGGLKLIDGNQFEGHILTSDSAGAGTWQSAGKFFAAYTETLSTYTAGTNDEVVILANAASNNITVNLPAAASNTDRVFYIKKIDSSGNTVTVDGNLAETIDDSTTYVISTQYDSVKVVSDGTEWWIT